MNFDIITNPTFLIIIAIAFLLAIQLVLTIVILICQICIMKKLKKPQHAEQPKEALCSEVPKQTNYPESPKQISRPEPPKQTNPSEPPKQIVRPTPQKQIISPGISKDPPKPTISTKQRVLALVQEIKAADVDNVPFFVNALKGYFQKYHKDDYSNDIKATNYYRLWNNAQFPNERVVIVGDIHGDLNSLIAVLLKLSVSDYDYFEKARFVFLGDYLDRGTTLFEPLLLLLQLKDILGDRMVMLKGNHEMVLFDENKQVLLSKVSPHQSCDCLNKYCAYDKEFLRQFAYFLHTLPTYVYMKSAGNNILLTHASIPRDINLRMAHFDEATGALIIDTRTSSAEGLATRNAILKDMIWGDPRNCDEKMQIDGRFEFGRKQWELFRSHNRIALLIRSHEEASNGYQYFFDNRVVTVFSTGGHDNEQTGYPRVEPTFAIWKNGKLFVENIFLYRLSTSGQTAILNLFNNQQFVGRQLENLCLDNEFSCTTDTGEHIRQTFKSMIAAFQE